MARARFGFARIVGPQFHKKQAAPLGQEIEVCGPFFPQRIRHGAVKSFEADGIELENFRHIVGARKRVGVTQPHQRALLWTLDQFQRGGKDRHARALSTHQRAGHMETVFGEKLLEVISGDAPGNPGIALADECGVSVPDFAQALIDGAATPALADDGLQIALAGSAHFHARAVVEQDVELFNVVHGLAGKQRMCSAGVVANHPAQRAAAVRGGIGDEGEVMGFRLAAQSVEHHAGLDAGQMARRVELEYLFHVFAEIENHGDVAALSRQAGTCSSRQNGRAEFPAS